MVGKEIRKQKLSKQTLRSFKAARLHIPRAQNIGKVNNKYKFSMFFTILLAMYAKKINILSFYLFLFLFLHSVYPTGTCYI